MVALAAEGAAGIAYQLAVWWLGAAFVLLDTALPPARLRYLVADSGAVAVVAQPGAAEGLRPALPDGVSLLLAGDDDGGAEPSEPADEEGGLGTHLFPPAGPWMTAAMGAQMHSAHHHEHRHRGARPQLVIVLRPRRVLRRHARARART